tara:strand:+ start:2924 stop:3661 length:738 start_codon:yes stop_codon:yes gene_type:complete
MDKKGLSYIDWSISIGIFVIFILALFILVIPSLDRRLDDRYLVSIAETGLKEEAYHTIYSLPLFIDHSGQSNSQVFVDLPSYPSEYTSLVVTDQNFNEKYSDGSINFGPVNLINGISEFNILYLVDGLHSSPGVPSGSSVICGIIPCTFGIEEKLIGFSKEKLDSLFNECTEYDDYVSYVSFKSSLSYPEQKEISVLIYEGEDLVYDCTFSEPEGLTPVYALSWRDKILNFDGSQNDISVMVRTW